MRSFTIGPPDRTAKLIALQHGTRLAVQIVEVIVGVEGVVPQVLKQASVNLVRSRLGDHADRAAPIAPVLRRVVVAEDAELGDGVGIRVKHHAISGYRIVRASIQQITHRIRAPACHRELAAAVSCFRRRHHAGLGQRQIQNIAPIQRQILDRCPRDRSSNRGIHSFDLRCLRFYLDGLGGRSNLQAHVDAQRLSDGEFLHPGDGFAEPRHLDRNRVHANGNIQRLVVSGAVGRGVPVAIGAAVGHRDFCAGHGGALRIGHRTEHPAVRVLGGNQNPGAEQEKNKNQGMQGQPRAGGRDRQTGWQHGSPGLLGMNGFDNCCIAETRMSAQRDNTGAHQVRPPTHSRERIESHGGVPLRASPQAEFNRNRRSWNLTIIVEG